jgi:peptidoglycan hydrolase-like protein with peptidoglycan-binding domain
MAGAGIGHAADVSSSPTNPSGSGIHTPSAMTASEILIRAAQQQLKYSGLYDGSVDGKMGSETQRALRQFQQRHGLRQSGALDGRTMTALQGDTGQVGSSLAPRGQPSGSGYTSGSGRWSWLAPQSRNSARRHCGLLGPRREADVDAAFTAIAEQQGLIVGGQPFSGGMAQQVATLAARPRVPAISNNQFVKAGGVIGYGNNDEDAYRQVGFYTGQCSRAPNPAICRSSDRPNSSWRSTSRPARRSASPRPTRVLDRADEVIEWGTGQMTGFWTKRG